MKTNILAIALAAVALVGFSACDKKDKEPSSDGVLALDQNSVNLKVGETATLTATVEAEWNSSAPAIAEVKGNGKTAEVKALAEGSAVVTASTKDGQTKTCVVLVTKEGGNEGGGKAGVVKGSQFWPIIMDGITLEANKSKMVASFQPDDTEKFFYIWEGGVVYKGVDAVGLNVAGNTEGFTALEVTNLGWAGAGFCLTENGTTWQAAAALNADIVANPDDYFLHIAIKSTDNYSHCFYILGSEATKFVLGSKSVYDGPVYSDFTRDGSWAEFDIPMSSYAAALSTAKVEAGVNVFVVLSEGVEGAKLNLDAVYFYKK